MANPAKIILMFTFLILLAMPISLATTTDYDAYWTFDDTETSGTTSIDKTGTYYGTIHGATTGVTGQVDEAYDFDDGDDTIDIPGAKSTNDITISVWINFDSIERFDTFYDDWTDGDKNLLFSLGNDPANDITIFTGNGGGGTQAELTYPITSISTGTWYHLVAVRNNGDLTLYINGNQVATKSTSYTGGPTSVTPAIGNNHNGKMDEVGIWNRALTPSEIDEVYQDGVDGDNLPVVSVSLIHNVTPSTLTIDSLSNQTCKFNDTDIATANITLSATNPTTTLYNTTFPTTANNTLVSETFEFNRSYAGQNIDFVCSVTNGTESASNTITRTINSEGLNITVSDIYNGTAIQSFNVSYIDEDNDTVFVDTTDGQAELNLLDRLYNITVNTDLYFPRTYDNVNASLNNTIASELYPYYEVYMTDKYRNNTINNFSVKVNGNTYSDGEGLKVYVGERLPDTTLYNISGFSEYFNHTIYNVNVTDNNAKLNITNNLTLSSYGTTFYLIESDFTLDAGVKYYLNSTVLNVTGFNGEDFIWDFNSGKNITISDTIMTLRVRDILFENNIQNATCDYWLTNNTRNSSTGVFEYKYIVTNNSQINCTAPDHEYQASNITFSTYNLDFVKSIFLVAIYKLNFFDEDTRAPFDMSSYDDLQLLVYCPDETVAYDIPATSTQFNFSEDCEYDKIKFNIDYPSGSYYRSLLFEAQKYDWRVFLINLQTSQAVFNTFQTYDLLGDYDNARLLVNKRINASTEQITADYLDVQGQVPAYLLFSGEYSLELRSDNKPVKVLGAYTADDAGTITVRLFDLSLEADATSYGTKVEYSAEVVNVTGTQTLKVQYNSKINGTNSVRLKVYNSTGVFYDNTVSDSNRIDWSVNVNDYINDTINMELIIDHEAGSVHTYKRTFSILSDITEFLGIEQFYSKATFYWATLFILTSIVLMFDLNTGNMAGLVTCAIAGLFNLFGWFNLSLPVMGLALLIAMLEYFSEKKNQA